MMFKRKKALMFAVLALGLISGGYILLKHSAGTNDPQSDGHGGEEGHGTNKHVALTPAQIANANLTIEKTGPAKIRTTLHLSGVIGPNEERMTQIVPRFEGVIRAIHKRLGDSVRRGEALLTIESNDSLRNYDITAPIDGTVTARSAALGEYGGNDKSLLVVADLSTVWANFSVYRRDFEKVQINQAIHVGAEEASAEPVSGTISYVSRVAYADTQSTTARAVLDNADGRWLPGQFVVGDVTLSESVVPIAVRKTALQTIDNQTVVFIRDGEHFEPRAVVVGAMDSQMAEIRSGLREGDAYVATNSFILKSELGKYSAEHAH